MRLCSGFSRATVWVLGKRGTMAWHRFYVAAGLTSVVFGLTGCRWWHHAPPQGNSGPVSTGTVLREPVVPAGYTKVAPLPADSSAGILSQTATVFRGSLK